MCKELDDEMQAGQEAATALVQHVERMGASRLTIPVEGEGCSVWEIKVTLVAK